LVEAFHPGGQTLLVYQAICRHILGRLRLPAILTLVLAHPGWQRALID
jgi:hypothetical protein